MKIVKTLLYLAFSIQTFAAFMLPMKFDKKIDNDSGYQEYQIENSTNKTVRYKIYKKTEPEDMKDKGIVGDMTKWIQYYPKILTIPPKTTGIVKLAIRAPKGTKPGEYVARIGTSPLAIPSVGDNQEAISPQISVPLGSEMRIFGYVGDIAPKIEGDFKTVEVEEEKFFKGTIKNTGEAGMKLIAVYKYSDKDGKHSSIVPLGRVYPGTEITIDTKPTKSNGKHKGIELEIKEDGGHQSFLKIK